MRFLQQFASALLLVAAGTAQAAASWGFDDASVTVIAKKAAEGGSKAKLSQKTPLAIPIALGSLDTLKVLLTAKDAGSAKRPHQAFLVLKEQASGLEAPFPLNVKENGKAVVQIVSQYETEDMREKPATSNPLTAMPARQSQKDIPVQLLLSAQPLKASVVIASFGATQGLNTPVFDVQITMDPSATPPSYTKPLRYGKQPDIHHIFRDGPKSPPKVVSLFFVLAVLATVPALFIGWALLGANVDHLTKALGTAPLSHATFFGSIVAMELVFLLYYTSWNLFQTVPVAGLVGLVAVFSGTKALGEVQSRRLAGQR
ncbi:Oligosaccharyltransferase subunit Ribophorin II-domain-containing protein [Cercophora scortea]|uniref:Oligosaccharyltransferase subunit Ribophorin II-domain-containing protein n=1 Tax=Cercophora scortea TaxID=314031 RepID=A0AAE0J3D8_9PEZI|nr:Oligosaccharyltransferase subunit Ribophorin II-domain-containing protein [Cercophora scortea]